MDKKKALTLVAALTLVGAVGIGATLAYFTDTAEVENVFTMGHVDVTLTENEVEPEVDEDGNPTGEYVQKEDPTEITEEGLKFEDVMPGQTVPKNPTITVAADSENCYVRATFEVAFTDTTVDSKYADALAEDIHEYITAEGSMWTYTDGYYYYAEELAAGDTAVLFDKVTIPGAEWDNAVADKEFTIKIKADAIQSVYVDDVVVKEDGKVVSWTIDADAIQAYGVEDVETQE